MGNAFGPLALLLVGISVAYTPVRGQLRQALGIVALKNVLHPLLMLAMGLLFGLHGLQMAVMVVAASLPIGANVLLFSQRYGVAEDLMATAMALSTVLGLVTVAATMALVQRL
jgi:predicted permease